jgi:hypothetical protein
LSAFNWSIDEGNFSSWNTSSNQVFGVHSIGQIDEGSSFKLEHSFKSSFWSAFNWPIDEDSSFKLEHPTNEVVGVHSIGQ